MVEKDIGLLCVEGPLASQLLYWHIFWSCQEMWNKSIIHPQFHISHRIWHTKYSFSKVIQKYLCQNVREWEIQIFKKVPKCEYLLSAEEKIWKPLFEFKPDIMTLTHSPMERFQIQWHKAWQRNMKIWSSYFLGVFAFQISYKIGPFMSCPTEFSLAFEKFLMPVKKVLCI